MTISSNTWLVKRYEQERLDALKKNKTRASLKYQFECQLNDMSPNINEEEFIFNGRFRRELRVYNRFGTGLKKYDPKRFDQEFEKWLKKQNL